MTDLGTFDNPASMEAANVRFLSALARFAAEREGVKYTPPVQELPVVFAGQHGRLEPFVPNDWQPAPETPEAAIAPIEAVAEAFNVSVAHMLGRTNRTLATNARGVAIKLLHDMMQPDGTRVFLTAQIAEVVGKRSVETIIRALCDFDKRATEHPEIAAVYAALKSQPQRYNMEKVS